MHNQLHKTKICTEEKLGRNNIKMSIVISGWLCLFSSLFSKLSIKNRNSIYNQENIHF